MTSAPSLVSSWPGAYHSRLLVAPAPFHSRQQPRSREEKRGEGKGERGRNSSAVLGLPVRVVARPERPAGLLKLVREDELPGFARLERGEGQGRSGRVGVDQAKVCAVWAGVSGMARQRDSTRSSRRGGRGRRRGAATASHLRDLTRAVGPVQVERALGPDDVRGEEGQCRVACKEEQDEEREEDERADVGEAAAREDGPAAGERRESRFGRGEVVELVEPGLLEAWAEAR